MIDSNNILIVCRDLKSVQRLSSFKIESQSSYILASDDLRVQKAGKRYSWIDEVCWIEQMESFYNVADDVIHLTETVNEWLRTLANDKHGFPEELLFFTRHVEGGMTTQRIQDLLLLIRSYHFLLDTYKITSAIVISQPGMGWEDEVLIETARSRNVDIKVIGRYSIAVLIKKGESFLKIYARVIYYAVNVLRINLCSRFKSKNTEVIDKEIVFQLCSSAYKHVENIVPLMKALKNKGYNPVALCWHSNERYTKDPGATQVRREGLQTEQLEQWCSFSDIWRSISGVLWTWRKAKKEKSKFLSHPALNYQSVPIGVLLWPSARFFIIAELAQSYSLRQALKKYFKSHSPIAIKLWGATALREGYLAWESLDIKGDKPVIFDYMIGAYIEWPYRTIVSIADIFFVAGEMHKRFIEKCSTLSDEQIKVTGHGRYEHITDVKKNSKAESRAYFKIPTIFSMYILYDPNMILRGFMATKEQIVTLNSMLRFADRHPSVALLVKPHPGHHTGILEDMINCRNDLKNVFLFDKGMLPYHALNAADVLITKFSTLGIEAMMFGCPVICCVLDGEQRFNIYEDATDYVDNLEKIEALLHRLVTEQTFRKKWHERHMKLQKQFLSEYFFVSDRSPSFYQAKLLDKCIRNREY